MANGFVQEFLGNVKVDGTLDATYVKKSPQLITIAANAWTGTIAPFSYTIAGARHGLGTGVSVLECNVGKDDFYWQTDYTDGTIKVYSNEKIDCVVAII